MTDDYKKMTIRLNEDTYEELREFAFEKRVSMISLIERYVKLGLCADIKRSLKNDAKC